MRLFLFFMSTPRRSFVFQMFDSSSKMAPFFLSSEFRGLPVRISIFQEGKKYLTSRFIFPPVNFLGENKIGGQRAFTIVTPLGFFDFVAQR